jgi:uncharacterized coiled-coil protein SlyX
MDEVQAKLDDVEETIAFLHQRIRELKNQIAQETLVRDQLRQLIQDRGGRHGRDD